MLAIHFLPRHLADYLSPSAVILTRALRAAFGVGTKYWLEWIVTRNLSKVALREVAGMHPAMRLAILDWQRRIYALDVTKLVAYWSKPTHRRNAAAHMRWVIGPSWTREEAGALLANIDYTDSCIDEITIHDVTWASPVKIRHAGLCNVLRLARVPLPLLVALEKLPRHALKLIDLQLGAIVFDENDLFNVLYLTRCTMHAAVQHRQRMVHGIGSTFYGKADWYDETSTFTRCVFN